MNRAMVISWQSRSASPASNGLPAGALLVATDPSYATAFGGGSDALVLLLVDLQHYGYLIAQNFFALWLFPLGLLAYRSGMSLPPTPRRSADVRDVGGELGQVGDKLTRVGRAPKVAWWR
jgi:Domain of unknown function (DUF4386)